MSGKTKQGVRDLGGNNNRPRREPNQTELSKCPHAHIEYHCVNCTNKWCLDCGITLERDECSFVVRSTSSSS